MLSDLGDTAVVVTARLLVQGLQERLLGLGRGDLLEVGDRLPAPSRARGLEVPDCHCFVPFLPLAITSMKSLFVKAYNSKELESTGFKVVLDMEDI